MIAHNAYEISCARLDRGADIGDERIVGVVRHALCARGVDRARISVAIVDDERMAELHERHLGIAGPTDVLTFDLSDSGEAGAFAVGGDGVDCGDGVDGVECVHGGDERASGASGLEGEIVISMDTAVRAAGQRGHDPAVEVLLYAVHGVLHLTGMDDHDPADAAAMHEMEDRILAGLGVGRVFGGSGE